MINTTMNTENGALNNASGPLIPTFVQQCDTLERLKKHLLASSSDSSSDDDDPLGNVGDMNSDSDDKDDELILEARLTLEDMRKRRELQLDERV